MMFYLDDFSIIEKQRRRKPYCLSLQKHWAPKLPLANPPLTYGYKISNMVYQQDGNINTNLYSGNLTTILQNQPLGLQAIGTFTSILPHNMHTHTNSCLSMFFNNHLNALWSPLHFIAQTSQSWKQLDTRNFVHKKHDYVCQYWIITEKFLVQTYHIFWSNKINWEIW